MSIDKRWIHLRDCLSNEFWEGLTAFIEIGKNHVNSRNETSCPCQKCRNQRMWPIETVHGHIGRWDFDPLYTIWRYHGEADVIANTNIV